MAYATRHNVVFFKSQVQLDAEAREIEQRERVTRAPVERILAMQADWRREEAFWTRFKVSVMPLALLFIGWMHG